MNVLNRLPLWSSSVASFLVLGGGGGARPPNVPTKIIMYLYCASERLRNIYFQDSKSAYTMSYTINAVSFNYLWYGAIYTTLTRH